MWMQLKSGGTPILSSSKHKIINMQGVILSYQPKLLTKCMNCTYPTYTPRVGTFDFSIYTIIISYFQEESGEMCEKIAGGALRVSLPDILMFSHDIGYRSVFS